MQSPSKGTFITSDTGQSVLEAYKQLNNTIDSMDKKVEHVIKKHEAQFLFAYRSHISKIKKELAEIKHKSQEQQKMFSANDRIQYLEKQMIIFRQEAFKLYDKIDEKTQQNELLKARVKQLEKQQQMIDLNEKERMRNMKLDEMNKSALNSKVEQLEYELSVKEQQIAKLNKKIDDLKQENLRRTVIDNKGLLSTSRRGSSLKQKTKKIEVYDSEMKEWFIDCIRTVKRQISARNINNPSLDLSSISSIDEFKTVDKLRLLEIFLQNEKLMTWMYERIFPDRLSQIRSKLTSFRQSEDSKGKQKQDLSMSMNNFEKIYLPKVARGVKSQLRSSVVVRNGKLNISQF